ncbi:histone-like nucleoid-structuring protein Lsr2 [Glycomyces harbinensis]|uniref:Lsr2 protein n=1 Tax=Glycomyces harbinensis TaxID=58114 RepID=A0A1G6QRE4_9ACTN|nr:Lsr2 family protein [Glycomyces harbinensis]SDC94295.1 Lsr2 protein [Glycomyces harbinensis]
MAKQTVVTLTDDIDGSEAAESVEFGIDGYLYSIDLSTAHADELRDRLTAYQEFGTRLGGYSTRSAAAVAPKRAVRRGDRDRNLDIRRWAEAQGLPVKARGKISDTVIAEYEAAHGEAA